MVYESVGLEIIMKPISKCPYTGKERAIKCADTDVRGYACIEGSSVRFVMYQNGKSVSGLQLMLRKEGFAIVANVITAKKHRRKGYAKRLWAEAKRHYPKIFHSGNLSEDGKIFASKCN